MTRQAADLFKTRSTTRDFLFSSADDTAGKRDAALVELERLFSTVFPISKSQLQIDHRWDFFRDDERFNELIRPEGAES